MVRALIERLEEHKPAEGLVQALQVTEKQYASIACIVGGGSTREELDTTEGLVVL
jgi:CRISPR-associated protein Cas2